MGIIKLEEIPKLNAYIGNKILTERLIQKVSQEDLAKAIGITRVQITNIELGNSGISINTLFKISEQLALPIQKIIPINRTELEKFIPVDFKKIKRKTKLEAQVALLQAQLRKLEDGTDNK